MLYINLLTDKLLFLRPIFISLLPIYFFFALLLDFWMIPLVSSQEQKTVAGATEDEVIIESDTQSTDNMGDVFTAYGNVRITYAKNNIVASAQQVQYLKNEKIIVLTGDVDIVRGGRDSLHGQRIVYFLKDDQIVADSLSNTQVLLKFNIDSANSNQRPSSL